MAMKIDRLFRSAAVIVFVVALSLSGCLQPGDEAYGTASFDRSGTPPNVVFILADDMGYHDLGSYGQSFIETPNVDGLAAEGVRFTDFYAGSSVCAPSRSVLMTGQHTGHTKVRANYVRAGGLPGSGENANIQRIGLQETDTTIGNVLQQAGYRTGLMGKWHLSGYKEENAPVYRGFDEYGASDGSGDGSEASAMEMMDGFMPDYNDDVKTLNAIRFIKRNSDGPFFLLLSLNAPHKPFNIPAQGPYADESWNEMSKNYAAMITRTDQYVGFIMETLREEGLVDNTVVIFGSDNGGEYRPYDGSKEDWEGDEEAYPVYDPPDWAEWTRLFRSTHPLRGGKGDMYEGGIRVPIIIRWPGRIEAGSVNTDPWHFMDFMPTLAAMAGVAPPARTDGIDMLPILRGEADYPEDRYLYWEFYHLGLAQAVRWRDWKLIRWSTRRKRIYGQPRINDQRRSDRYPLLELYNLEDDIGEEHNVVEQYPQVRHILLDLMNRGRTETPYWPLTDEEKEGIATSGVPNMY